MPEFKTTTATCGYDHPGGLSPNIVKRPSRCARFMQKRSVASMIDVINSLVSNSVSLYNQCSNIFTTSSGADLCLPRYSLFIHTLVLARAA